MNIYGFTTDKYEKGVQIQSKIVPVIKKVLNQDIKESSSPTSKYDCYNDNYLIEIKSRNLRSIDYDLWMCNSEKFHYKDDNKKILLFYYFVGDNRLFYIEYDIKKFSTYKLRFIYGKNQYLIPSKDFIEVFNHHVILSNE